MKRVINATGVILHTGLGRAPLGRELLERLIDIAPYYLDLEFNLETGLRGDRQDELEKKICAITGFEAAAIFNNNAGAILVLLSSLANGKKVLAFRQELVAIGGSFRVPEILKASGASLCLAGAMDGCTTEEVVNTVEKEKPSLILKTHTSNFKVEGGIGLPSLGELVEIGHKADIPVIYDLGSGQISGTLEEERVGDMSPIGLAAVAFSGDKILGGPQSGIVVGDRDIIDRARRNPIARAVRIDKITSLLLGFTLDNYLEGRIIPTESSRLINRSEEERKQLAGKLGGMLSNIGFRQEVIKTSGRIGSGALPLYPVPSYAVALDEKNYILDIVARYFRQAGIPVVGRTSLGLFELDIAAVFDEEIEMIAESASSVLEELNK